MVDEVGADAVRFIMLMRKNDATLDFDLAKVIEQSARQSGVLCAICARPRRQRSARRAQAAFADLDLSPAALARADLRCSSDEGERALMRKIAQFPRIVSQAAEAREPHRVAFFAHELATQFHSHWTRGKDTPHLRFVNEKERKLSYSRLSLVAGVGLVLASALVNFRG